eukprot:TRINITY_DN10561_c0_g1_i1.p1 TRINITY_DN10561_c0_g1~~TRINITY_DN10561_c0_g1_i1.p1  ORF type:complete len:327 (-),score=100.33 TRINITY_DN10561_c0_g1_i1:33-992(-)
MNNNTSDNNQSPIDVEIYTEQQKDIFENLEIAANGVDIEDVELSVEAVQFYTAVYANELASLELMGFVDVDLNLKTLVSLKGDLDYAIASLSGEITLQVFDPLEVYEDENNILKSMGFENEQDNIDALQDANGDIELAISFLSGETMITEFIEDDGDSTEIVTGSRSIVEQLYHMGASDPEAIYEAIGDVDSGLEFQDVVNIVSELEVSGIGSYATENEVLLDMGFSDENANLDALMRTDGDITIAIQILSGDISSTFLPLESDYQEFMAQEELAVYDSDSILNAISEAGGLHLERVLEVLTDYTIASELVHDAGSDNQ